MKEEEIEKMIFRVCYSPPWNPFVEMMQNAKFYTIIYMKEVNNN